MSDQRNAKEKGATKPCCAPSASGVPNKPPSARRRANKPKTGDDVEEEAVPVPTGFERNLEAQRIMEALEFCGKMYFLMKWKGLKDELDLVCAEQAKILCPEIVIEFYERNLTWVKPEVEPQ